MNKNLNYTIVVATFPFGTLSMKPREILEQSGCKIVYNPYGRRLKNDEVKDFIKDADGVIAGTEVYSREVLKNASKLKVISRVANSNTIWRICVTNI